MPAQHHAQHEGRSCDALVHCLLFATALSIARRALAKRGVSKSDVDDVAQEVMIAAYLRRGTFDPSRGTLEQWLKGIARIEARAFRRRTSKRPMLGPTDVPDSVASPGPPQEGPVFLNELAKYVFDFLPEEEQRVVVLHDIENLPFEQIAKKEGIAVATAFARHERAIAKIQAWADEERTNGVMTIPAIFREALDPDLDPGPPSPEVVERAWRRVAPLLGIELPPESEPPPSGTRRLGRVRKLGPLLAVLLASGLALDGSSSASPEETTGARPLTSCPAVPSGSPMVVSVTPTAAPSPTATAGPATPPVGPVLRRAEPAPAISHAKRVLIEKARPIAATSAVEILADHAERVPNGQHAAEGERAWILLCARYRDAHMRGADPEMEKRCAGR